MFSQILYLIFSLSVPAEPELPACVLREPHSTVPNHGGHVSLGVQDRRRLPLESTSVPRRQTLRIQLMTTSPTRGVSYEERQHRRPIRNDNTDVQ